MRSSCSRSSYDHSCHLPTYWGISAGGFGAAVIATISRGEAIIVLIRASTASSVLYRTSSGLSATASAGVYGMVCVARVRPFVPVSKI